MTTFESEPICYQIIAGLRLEMSGIMKTSANSQWALRSDNNVITAVTKKPTGCSRLTIAQVWQTVCIT